MKASVLLLTFNEEANLPRCLAALAWCDDIVAIDFGSTDRTIETLKSSGVRIFTRPFDDFAGQRNFGLNNGAFRHEWVLHLDADEVVTPQFVAALGALEPASGIDGYYVASKTMLFNRWLKHAGMWPSYQARIGHRERMRFRQVGHGQREDVPPSRMAVFAEPYLHYSFSHGMKRWLEKHVRYACDEAALLRVDQGAARGEEGDRDWRSPAAEAAGGPHSAVAAPTSALRLRVFVVPGLPRRPRWPRLRRYAVGLRGHDSHVRLRSYPGQAGQRKILKAFS